MQDPFAIAAILSDLLYGVLVRERPYNCDMNILGNE